MKHPISTPEAFQALTGVDNATLDRFKAYSELLTKWQARVNLVGPKTLPDLWHRHMADSAQLFQYLPEGPFKLLDMGSGAGFPGLVLALLGAPEVHLVESDQKKSIFLREVARICDLPVSIHPNRIEKAESFQADVITARAFAPVEKLLDFAAPHLKSTGYCLFLKGRSYLKELTDSQKKWHMEFEKFSSATDPEGVVLKIKGVRRHHGRQQLAQHRQD